MADWYYVLEFGFEDTAGIQLGGSTGSAVTSVPVEVLGSAHCDNGVRVGEGGENPDSGICVSIRRA